MSPVHSWRAEKAEADQAGGTVGRLPARQKVKMSVGGYVQEARMIWKPRPGQAVQLRYRKTLRELTGRHEVCGVVIAASIGPKQRNATVDIGGETVVVPRGNLFAMEDRNG